MLRGRHRWLTAAGLLLCLASVPEVRAQQDLTRQCLETMRWATRFMVEKVSTRGGYVWQYLPDMSRRWGEMEAYPTMIWLQSPGTPEMGHLFLDAYEVTGDEYYYEAACRAAGALIWGQLDCGGWNYMIDFAGERSLRRWYETIGRNGWRLEEFQHYYGNATFDDRITVNAARFLLRIYLKKLDARFKPALDRAIAFVLESQYPAGGWPQRYPLKNEFGKPGHPDYTAYHTYNDDVIEGCIDFLLDCYTTLGDPKFIDPIYRGMNFFLITQQGPDQPGWAQQYTLTLEPAGARSYEPRAIMTDCTAGNLRSLMRFYRLTGQRKYLARIPEAIDWLEGCRLPDGRFARFVEVGTGRPLFVHRRGSNAIHGEYYSDYTEAPPLGHYGSTSFIDIQELRDELDRLTSMTLEQATKGSPLLAGRFLGTGLPQDALDRAETPFGGRGGRAARGGTRGGFGGFGVGLPESSVQSVLASIDVEGCWLSTRGNTSHPYGGDGTRTELTSQYASTNGGDETDTSPYADTGGQAYISTQAYMRNMRILMDYVRTHPSPGIGAGSARGATTSP